MVQQRSCRDVLCLLIFIAFWAGMFVICGIAVRQGEFRQGTQSAAYCVKTQGETKASQWLLPCR
jgi:hypothetical protein